MEDGKAHELLLGALSKVVGDYDAREVCDTIAQSYAARWQKTTEECAAKGGEELPLVLVEIDGKPHIQAFVFREGDVVIELPPILLEDIFRAYAADWNCCGSDVAEWLDDVARNLRA